MQQFRAIFALESKRFLNRKIIGLFLLFFLLSIHFVQNGIGNYKSIIVNKEKFQAIETLKVQQYVTYGQYGTYGFRVLFIPSPLSIYFINSCTIPELTANVDAGERLNIYNSFKNKTLFAGKPGGGTDFSGIMLLLGSLMVLYFGYESLSYKDYLRWICCITTYKKFFFLSIFTRLLLIILFFIFNIGISLILLKINAVTLLKSEYTQLLIYLGVLGLMMGFFFSLGTLAGSLKSRITGSGMIIITWFVCVFLVPGIIRSVILRKADNIVSNYQLELQKLEILMNFEERALQEKKDSEEDKIKLRRRLIESYWSNEVTEIHKLEKKMEKETERNIHLFQNLSLLFPSTFYLSVSNEVSSKGYENYINFYKYLQVLKEKFIRFYINKRYFENFSKVELFVKKQENLFYAESRLPEGFFIGGGILTLVYILVLFTLSYFYCRQSLKL